MIKWYQEVQFLANIMVSIKLHAFSKTLAYLIFVSRSDEHLKITEPIWLILSTKPEIRKIQILYKS